MATQDSPIANPTDVQNALNNPNATALATPNPVTVPPGTAPENPAPKPTTPPATPAPNPNMPTTGTNPAGIANADIASALNPNAAALATAKASGPPPQDVAGANTAVSDALKKNPPPPDTTVATTTLADDPGYQKLLKDATTAANTVTQGKTLVDNYKQMEADAGIPAIDEKLLSTKNIIDGSEDDIRKEVQAAGGFATNSQVMALADARNKTLIQNYNNLLATKANAESHINTMIGLAGQDKANAIAAANEQLNVDKQLNDYAQQFHNNANEAYKNVITAVGYSGLVNSLLNSDPTGKSLALAEQTLGLPAGQLKQVATQEKSAQNLQVIQAAGVTSPFVVTAQGEVWNSQTGYAYTSPEDFQAKTGMSLQDAIAKKSIQPPPPNMDALLKQAQVSKAQTDAKYAGAIDQANIAQSNAAIAASNASTAKTNADVAFQKAHGGMTQADYNKELGVSIPDPAKANTPGYDSTGLKYNDATAKADVLNHWQETSAFGSDGKISPTTYIQGKSDWVAEGLSATNYDSLFAQYADTKHLSNYGLSKP